MSTEHGGKKIMFGPFEVTSQVSRTKLDEIAAGEPVAEG